MTIPVTNQGRWQKLHIGLVWVLLVAWFAIIGSVALAPSARTMTIRGIALGVGAMLPHIWLGQRLWHDPKRTGIGIPITILTFRFMGSLILFAVFLWQFPAEREIVAWSGASLIIVFTVIEAFLFAKGVERL